MNPTVTTYVIFDGDNDDWAYRYLKGWNALPNVDFRFKDVHEEYKIRPTTDDETYIKSRLRKRFQLEGMIVLLIGAHTKNLHRYVRWELEVAINLELPIIAVNLDRQRQMVESTVPPVIREKYVVYVPFKMDIIKYALENFPREFRNRNRNESGPRFYPDSLYHSLSINRLSG